MPPTFTIGTGMHKPGDRHLFSFGHAEMDFMWNCPNLRSRLWSHLQLKPSVRPRRQTLFFRYAKLLTIQPSPVSRSYRYTRIASILLARW
jgi:hypothetical protein